jgi:hypothetical protein
MSTKLLFVLEGDRSVGQYHLEKMGDYLTAEAKKWLAGGGPVMAVGVPHGLRLKVYRVDGEPLAEPSQIEVRYTGPEPLCELVAAELEKIP